MITRVNRATWIEKHLGEVAARTALFVMIDYGTLSVLVAHCEITIWDN